MGSRTNFSQMSQSNRKRFKDADIISCGLLRREGIAPNRTEDLVFFREALSLSPPKSLIDPEYERRPALLTNFFIFEAATADSLRVPAHLPMANLAMSSAQRETQVAIDDSTVQEAEARLDRLGPNELAANEHHSALPSFNKLNGARAVN
jgi:hypothetical protein